MPNLLNTVRNTMSQRRGNRARSSRARNSRGGGGLASQASGFIGGLLSGGDNKTRNRGRGRARRRR
jgi:hypothetical protein